MKYSSFPILHDATQTYDTYLSYRRYAANINEGIVLVFDTGLSKLLETGSEASWKLTEELLSSEEIETFPAERLSAGMHSLGADFNIAMGGAMLNFDVKRAPVQASLTKLFEVFKKQDKAYLEDVMRQALKMYRDGFRNLKDETWAGDTLRLFLSLIEKFPQNALAYLYTAHLYHYQPRHLNFKRALEYYGLCFSCAAADVEQHLIGAQGCFYAGWISAVVFGNLDEAVELTNHALELDSTLSEAHYHLAKLYISQADIPRTIDHIKEAVSVDRRYCLKVVADDDFSLIKEDLRKYYFTVAEQDLAARSEELQRCSGDISDMMKMHTEDKLEYAKSLIESNSLKQLNEAIELLDGLQQRLEDEAAKQPEQEVE
ncbi:MAG: hypothetical protein GY868_16180, partial [Deltaproteobacteria bacterium]|nr:hypothetical protein [Deltaproteobacteria bacterium]